LYNLSAEFSLWFIPLCLALAAGISWFLYFKNPLNIENKWIKWSLNGLRFLSVFVLLFLLLGVLIKSTNKQVKKPIVVIAADNSESIITNKFGAEYKANLQNKINQLVNNLKDNYEVKTIAFGNDIQPDSALTFKQKQSNLEAVLNEIENNYSNQNLGAVIMATDGIYTKGNSPLESAKNLKVPFYTVALGDSNQQRDALIKNVRYNQIVFAGNEFEVEIDLAAFDFLNQPSLVQISHKGQSVFKQNITIDNKTFFKTIKAKLPTSTEGSQHFTVNITKQNNEISYVNNQFDFFVDVIKSKQKILIVGLCPHPDLSALKQAINQNQNYEASIILFNEASNDLIKKYDVVIAHQLPGFRNEAMPLVKYIIDSKTPCFFVLTNRTGFAQLNQLQNSLQFSAPQITSTAATAGFNAGNSSLYFDETTAKQIADFPPLQVAYGKYSLNAQSQLVLKQQIGYVLTNEPMLSIDNASNLAFLMGEGFWKWRLFDFDKNNSQVITSDLIAKVIQSIALKADKSFFKVKPIKQKFDEGENIVFDAQIYNQSYELQNTEDISLIIKNAQGKQFDYSFSKTDKSYTANLGQLPVGTYTYSAKSINQKEIKTGNFIVQALQAELTQTRADYQLLNTLANDTKGQFYTYANMDKIPENIIANENIQAVSYTNSKLDELINNKWIFFFILLLLSMEWFIRKWNGSI
jgi:ribosomal protein S24E